MKTIGLSLLTLFTFAACQTTDDGDAMLPQNTFISQRNNQDWKGTTELILTTNDTLIFLGDGDGIDNGILVFKV